MRAGRNLLRGAAGYNFSTPVASFGAEIDDAVSHLDHIEIMLDYHH